MSRTLVLAVLSLAFLAYSAIRAVRIPIVHDEAITCFVFVEGPHAGTLDPNAPFAENNHYLNSLLSAVSFRLLPGADVSLRLPNLLSYPLFLVATASLALRQPTGLLTVAVFLLLNAHAFAVEFFSLSRGYGLGLAFLAAGIALLVRAFERTERSAIPASLGVLCLGLAALSNLSFLLSLVACVASGAALVARRLASGRPAIEPARPDTLSRVVPLLASVPFLLVLVPYSMELSRKGLFYMGGRRGLWPDTVVSLLAVLRGRESEAAPRAPLLEAVILATILFLAAAVLIRPRLRRPALLVPAVLLALTAGATDLAHRLLGAPLPVERAALPIQFLFLAASTAAAGDWISRRRRGWPAVSAGTVLASLLVGLAFLRNANVTHTLTWRYDADNLKMLADLDRARRERAMLRPVRLGISWRMEPSINYYRGRRGLDWLLPVTRNGLADHDPDFVFYAPTDADAARRLPLIPLADYPVSGNRLAALDQPVARTSAYTGVSQP